MPYSEAQKRATDKYKRENYKRIPLDVPKADYETIKSHSAARGESVNGFVKRAISETMERDNAPQTQEETL